MIILARHGQAAWGTRDYDRLTETGTRQAQLLGRSFAAQGLAPTRLITGGMRRHEQTAAALAKEAGWSSEWEADPRFAELDHLDVIHAHRPAYRNDTLMRADLARTLRPRSAFWKMFDVALTGGAAGNTTTTTPRRMPSSSPESMRPSPISPRAWDGGRPP